MATAKKKVESETVEAEEVVTEVATAQYADDFYRLREENEKHYRARRQLIQSQLSEPFSADVERQLKKGGTYLTYIPVSEVIARLNKVLGYDAWSYEIIRCERDSLDPDFIVAHVRMSLHAEGDRFMSITKDGFGGQKIKRTKQGDIVDLGDEFKGAVSDALKKAAQSLGVGLYLARTEEALMQEQEETPAPVVQQQSAVADVSPLYESFISLRKSLDETGVSAIRTFWSEYSGGRPVPKANEFTDEELEALIGECVRLSFAGSFEDGESQ